MKLKLKVSKDEAVIIKEALEARVIRDGVARQARSHRRATGRPGRCNQGASQAPIHQGACVMAFTPICVACEREMRCRKNDFFFMDYDRAAVWAGDMYQCEGCAARVIVGVGRKPVIDAYEPEFERITSRAQVELTREPVKDPPNQELDL